MTVPYITGNPYIDADFASQDSSITTINGEITTINSNISTINGEITTINGEITTANTNIANVTPGTSIYASAGPSSSVTINDTVTYTSSGVTLASQTLAAGAYWTITVLGVTNVVSGAARSFKFGVYWGGTGANLGSLAVVASTAYAGNFRIDCFIYGASTTSAFTGIKILNNITSGAGYNLIQVAPTTATGLPSGAQTLDFQFGMTSAVAGDYWRIDSIVFQRVQ